jgi:hypothetical protein
MEKASPFLRLSLESAVVIDSMRIFGLVCAAKRGLNDTLRPSHSIPLVVNGICIFRVHSITSLRWNRKRQLRNQREGHAALAGRRARAHADFIATDQVEEVAKAIKGGR